MSHGSQPRLWLQPAPPGDQGLANVLLEQGPWLPRYQTDGASIFKHIHTTLWSGYSVNVFEHITWPQRRAARSHSEAARSGLL